MQASWVRSASSASDSTYSNTAARSHLPLVVQEPTLLPLGMEMVLSVPRVDVRLLYKFMLLLEIDALHNNILSHMATGCTTRLSNRSNQLCNLPHSRMGLLVLPDNEDCVQ